MSRNLSYGFIILIVLFASCSKERTSQGLQLFTLIPTERSGIEFINQLKYTEEFNAYTYRNFYNGGGVGLGDINNDGLIDLFLTGNQVSNKLYLNEGDFKFRDITEIAGVASKGVWSTGVSFADINSDGWLDIYVCKSGDPQGENRHNELFINNGDLTFTEKAHEYGIADKGLSTHAGFFDYDKDGDLDFYLLNNSITSAIGYEQIKDQRIIRDPEGGNKLYRNDGDHFTDVSREAGIYSSKIGFGLGVSIGDINKDGWQDLFISNDFFEKDYLYINNKDGTFKEVIDKQIRDLSLSSMGADIGDLNNDTYPEIYVTDMLPEKDSRYKTKVFFEDWEKYQFNVKNGYHHQFTRNVLQLNNKDGTFSEIGRLLGVEATDWSWGALIFDLNNDGYKDIFVANGIYKDLTDQDYINYIAEPDVVREILTRDNKVIKRLIDSIPSVKIPNYAFVNEGDLSFTNKAENLGLAQPGFSNGSAYGDLDNDGDLDLVINNVNMPLFLYRNNADILLNNHFLTIVLIGNKNTFAVGAQVTLKADGKTFYQELIPVRGFQSTVDHRLHFGLGSIKMIDTVEILWPDNRMNILIDIKTDQILEIRQSEVDLRIAGKKDNDNPKPKPILSKIEIPGLNYQHVENEFNDFKREKLIFHMLSTEGPKIWAADVNNDGFNDFFIGGAKDSPGALFVRIPDGGFQQTNMELFRKDQISEDTDCAFFDADNDGDQDLYVASGGNEFPSSSSALIDRLYVNDGNGNFQRNSQILPTTKFESTSTVKPSDYDNDGDFDLFIGIRLKPFLYGIPVKGYILNNDGKGNFGDVTEEIAPGFSELGMVTDAIWSDIENDGDPDLIIVGEWMPVRIFINENSNFKELQSEELETSSGFWNSIASGDFDQDGDIDFILGNHGLNSRIKGTDEEPIEMFINDFDGNGSVEQVITAYNGEVSYPMILRDDLLEQIPELSKKYPSYDKYKEQRITDIFSDEQIGSAVRLEVKELRTSILINEGPSQFKLRPLPLKTQFSPVYGILVKDFNKDGKHDILLGGNLYRVKPEIGKYDASYGWLLMGKGNNKFEVLSPISSGFSVKGEIRDIVNLQDAAHYKSDIILVAKNNDSLETFSIRENEK